MNDMTHSHERFLLSAFLPEPERAAIEAAATGDPLAESLVRASHDLRRTLGESEAFRSLPDTDDVIAFLAASRTSGLEDDSDWNECLAGLERRVLGRPTARATYDRFRRRIEELERGSDAEAHFRRLSGGGPPRILPLRSLMTAAAVVVAVAGTLVAGRLTEDRAARAAYESVRRSLDSRPVFRGEPPRSEALLRDAGRGRRMILGVWPAYDRDGLRALAERIGSPEAASDWLLLARVRLMAGERSEGEEALREAIRRGAGVEAERLYEALRAGPASE